MLKSLGCGVAMLVIAMNGRAARAQAEPPGSVKVILEPLGDEDEDDAATEADLESSSESELLPPRPAPPTPSVAPCATPCPSVTPPCGASPPCSSTWLRPPAAELAPSSSYSEARNALIAGAVMLAVGEAVGVFHALHDPTMHGLELIPVVGPVAGVFNYPANSQWVTPLLIASWLDAAGILTMAVAAAYAPHEREQRVRVSAGSTGRDSRVSVSFTF